MNGLVACRRGGQRVSKQALYYNLTDESVNYRPLKGGKKPIDPVVNPRRPSIVSSITSCSTDSDCSTSSFDSVSSENWGCVSADQSSRTGSKSSSRSSIALHNLKANKSVSKDTTKPSKCALCKLEVRYFMVRFASCGHVMHGECCWRYAATVAKDSRLNAEEQCSRCHWERQQKRIRLQSVDSWQSLNENEVDERSTRL